MQKLYHGAAFYPELWGTEIVEEDILHMQKIGINVVRIGEFIWSYIEPNEGEIDISFLVDIIKRLKDHGIDTVMCTPTATPPIWMSYQHPERMHVDKEGTVMSHGARQHICTNNAYFRKRAAIITEALAEGLGKLPGIIGWQLDNEFKCHVGECYCETCKAQWHSFLKQKYQTIEQLNTAWGTQIWSQYYQSFEQIPQPTATPFLHNASLSTIYKRFTHEKITEFANEQAAIIRRYSDAPITHNATVFFDLDQSLLFENLDFASFDTYAVKENISSFFMLCDLYRNIKKDTPFWLMETSTSFSASLERYASPHPDGYLQAEATYAYAAGAEGFCYWLWRQQRTGCEITHGSVVSAWGQPTIGYTNVLEVERIRKELEPFLLSTKPMQAEVAVCYSDRAKAYFQTEPFNGIQYKQIVTSFYERFISLGIHRDLIMEQADLDGYKLLFTPFIPYLSSEYIQRAIEFVEKGGIWIVGPLSGGRTINHTNHTDCALGELEKQVGVHALFTNPLDGTNTYGEAFGITAELGLWSTIFDTENGENIGLIKEGLGAGKAFIKETKKGKGKIIMLGSLPVGQQGEKMIEALIQHYVRQAAIKMEIKTTPGTVMIPRVDKDASYYVIVNMDGKTGKVTLPKKSMVWKSNQILERGTYEIPPYNYRVIKYCF
ncbi:beta-galactosidase [Niallia sp. FSL W8-0635]|uniref:beta-galactosidase n=1 Tax=Niallia sp. FSL W8-0635 TaxID=2975337 RepID=UPI002B02FF15|nr:beta-galactosidase [Yersinia enterocolitica]